MPIPDDPVHSLTPELASRLVDGVDRRALERFLGALPEELRPFFLEPFLKRESPFGVGDSAAVDIRVNDNPTLRRLLWDVWAPRRERLRQDPAFWRSEAEYRVRHAPATVALVPSLEDPSALVAVYRRPEAAPQELILLRDDAATGTLWAAGYWMLQRLRDQPPQELGSEQRVFLPDATILAQIPSDPEEARRHHGELDDRIQELRGTPPKMIAGLPGPVPAVVYDPWPPEEQNLPAWDPRATPPEVG